MYLHTSPGPHCLSPGLVLGIVNLFDTEAIPYCRNTHFRWTSFAYVHFSFEINPRFFIFFEGLK